MGKKEKKTEKKDKPQGTVEVGKPSKKSGKGSKIDPSLSHSTDPTQRPERKHSQDPKKRHAVVEDPH
jgi:hypothetical protein